MYKEVSKLLVDKVRGLLVLAELLRLDVPRIEWAQGSFICRRGWSHGVGIALDAQAHTQESPHGPDATAQRT